jgi:hypothetical protein
MTGWRALRGVRECFAFLCLVGVIVARFARVARPPLAALLLVVGHRGRKGNRGRALRGVRECCAFLNLMGGVADAGSW